MTADDCAMATTHDLRTGKGTLSLPRIHIKRSVLCELVDECAPVLTIMAPPGFGKSTLALEWASHRDPSKTAWVNASLRYDSPAFFWPVLHQAIDQANPVPTGDEDRHGGRGGVEGVLERLHALGGGFAIVVDDAHLIHDSTLQSEISVLVDDLPPDQRLILLAVGDQRKPGFRINENWVRGVRVSLGG
jgi:ATP/maltotriose-dependent transcriptional regulator MalT